MKDPVVVFVDRTFLLWVALSLLIPFAIGGWSGLLWGGLVRMFFVHRVPVALLIDKGVIAQVETERMANTIANTEREEP